MNLRELLQKLPALARLDALRAMLRWPKFSVTSYTMVSSLYRQGLAPKSVIDVGANVGQFAVAAANFFPAAVLHCFEPEPASVAELQKNLRALPQARVYPLALGDRDGEISFHVNTHRHSSSVLSLAPEHRRAFPGAQEEATISVPIATLDTVFRNTDLPRPVLLKLDVQGYEPAVIRGGRVTLARVDYVLMETSFKPLYQGEMLFPEILEMMGELDFHFERPVGWLCHPRTGEIMQMDALFASASRSGPQDAATPASVFSAGRV